jgi:hypothetical protein
VGRTSPISTDVSQGYATSAEFCRVFAQNMDSMHLLSFLLTADLTKAEECCVSGLEGCVEKSSNHFQIGKRSFLRPPSATTESGCARCL